MIQFLSFSFFPLLMMLGATADVLTRRIPNLLILVMLLTFPPLAWAAGMGAGQLALHAGTAFGMLALGFVFFSFGLFGGGDAKFLAAAALWLGPEGLVPFVVLTVLAGGLLSLAVMAWTAVSIDAELRGSQLIGRLGWLRPKVPYGYAIAAGALLALRESWWGALSLS